MYDHILLAVAFQKWALYRDHALTARDVAMTLALGASKRLHILTVYGLDEDDELPCETDSSVQIVAGHREDAMQSTTQLIEQQMLTYVAPLKDAGLQVDTILQVGHPAEIIAHTACSLPADLLILGCHRKRGIVDMSLGRTARQLYTHAPCPIIFVSAAP